MLKKNLILVTTLALLCCSSYAYAQRGPSTPEERKQAVEMVTSLETNPLGKEAKDYRRKLLLFLADVPDINVTLCNSILGDSKSLKGDYEAELVTQLAWSQAKFIIENPDKAQDRDAVYLAAVEGVLRTWQSVKAAKPKAKFPLLDELLQKQQAGSLAEHVKAGSAGCK